VGRGAAARKEPCTSAASECVIRNPSESPTVETRAYRCARSFAVSNMHRRSLLAKVRRATFPRRPTERKIHEQSQKLVHHLIRMGSVTSPRRRYPTTCKRSKKLKLDCGRRSDRSSHEAVDRHACGLSRRRPRNVRTVGDLVRVVDRWAGFNAAGDPSTALARSHDLARRRATSQLRSLVGGSALPPVRLRPRRAHLQRLPRRAECTVATDVHPQLIYAEATPGSETEVVTWVARPHGSSKRPFVALR